MCHCSNTKLYLVEALVQFNIKDKPLHVTSTEKFTRIVRSDIGTPHVRDAFKASITKDTPEHLDCVFLSITIHEEIE